MSESSMKTWLGHYFSKLKSFFFSKDVLSFLLFLLLSFSFWFVNMLDKERETEILIPLRYSNLPEQFDITKSNAQFIKVLVKDKGLNLFAYSEYRLKGLTISLNKIVNDRGEIIFNNDELRAKLNKYLLPSTSILEIKPDSLILHYERLAMKELPIRLVGNIETAQQYILSEDVLIEPLKVKVYGPKRVVDKLNEVVTDTVMITDVDKNIQMEVKLNAISNVRFSTNDVKLSISAEMFTEKELFFPIKIINCPPDLIVRTFPAQVKLKFNVGLSHFKSVSINDVNVLVDYFEILKNNTGRQKINIQNKASFISNIRSEYEEVEYVIERKK
ncbi:MAG: CdaR family protein [Paludibacter sp.]